MKRHSPIATVAAVRSAVLVCAVVLVCAAPAGANPLLSGYGGPGSGSQVLLGGTLIGGGGSGSGGGSQPLAASSAEAGRQRGSEASPAGSAAGVRGGRSAARSLHGSGGAQATRHDSAAHAGPAGGEVPLSGLASPASSQPLGLTGTDALLIVIAALGLLAVAALTWRLARPGAAGEAAKGMPGRPRRGN
jgi:hypothetical protein